MKQKKPPFIFLDHTADIKFVAHGTSLDDAFVSSALATLNVIYDSEKKVDKKEEKDIIVKGKDYKSLLYNFLEEIIYLVDSENFLTGEIVGLNIVKEKTGHYVLKCKLWGDSSRNYKNLDHIKSVTYSEMIIEEDKNKNWMIQVVLDV
ncbi:protein archease [Candidatus Pacearchaeota archaeon CG10_big_fil_rev_8_21_14_0_10_32_14]|nr:MAG: protein archease [Candidatus Pacearchaeota archaeon CG10_big_fil_rev_8_21_14_0_10_32_14]